MYCIYNNIRHVGRYMIHIYYIELMAHIGTSFIIFEVVLVWVLGICICIHNNIGRVGRYMYIYYIELTAHGNVMHFIRATSTDIGYMSIIGLYCTDNVIYTGVVNSFRTMALACLVHV